MAISPCAARGRARVLKALDGREYELDGEMTVIADNDAVLSLGGVIGGEGTGCSDGTRDVFIEAALRSGAHGRDRAQAWGFTAMRATASSAGSIPNSPGRGWNWRRISSLNFAAARRARFARRVRSRIGGGRSDSGPRGPKRWAASINAATEQRRILEALGCVVAGEGPALHVTPPSWRADIVGEADLVEEVLRIHGYDHIPTVPLSRDAVLPKPALDPAQRRADFVRRALAARDLIEAVTFSFLPATQAELFGGASETLRLVNPISADLDRCAPRSCPIS